MQAIRYNSPTREEHAPIYDKHLQAPEKQNRVISKSKPQIWLRDISNAPVMQNDALVDSKHSLVFDDEDRDDSQRTLSMPLDDDDVSFQPPPPNLVPNSVANENLASADRPKSNASKELPANTLKISDPAFFGTDTRSVQSTQNTK